jgi:GR25 family glycosyltransferase involved in LPS biosynthesis
MELLLQKYKESGTLSDVLNIFTFCKVNKLYNLGALLGNYFMKTFNNINCSTQTLFFLKETKQYEECFDLCEKILNTGNIDKENTEKILTMRSLCIPFISDRYVKYDREIVKKILNKKTNPFPTVTFSITTCKRYDLFEKTMNSFLNCCEDLDLIDTWICVDDNSSEEDRIKMRRNYPFFDFYFKNIEGKGHPQSMNIIRDETKTPYLFHMEDDFKYFVKKRYISLCLDVLTQSDTIKQCLINKNYAETEIDVRIKGGIPCVTGNSTKFSIHEHCPDEKSYKAFFEKYGMCANCAYWEHFSFRPSLIKTEIFKTLGPFSITAPHFERDYSCKYKNKGYVSAFLEGIYNLHIGRLTSERDDKTKINAYVLNGEEQFVKKQPVEGQQVEEEYKLKTFVVNLDRRQDRMKEFSVQADSLGFSYTRFSAVDGIKLKPNKQLQKIFENNDYNMRQGIVGCALSHIKLCIDMINSDNDTFLILEDDVKFVLDFQTKLNIVLESLKNTEKTDFPWDLCYVCHHSKVPENQTVQTIKHCNKEESFSISYGGTGGYLITRKGALKLLNFIEKNSMTNAIDTVQQLSANELNVYYSEPQLLRTEMYLGTDSVDTDIQKNHGSLNLEKPEEIKDALSGTERLKKNGVFSIEDAIQYK